MFESIGRSIELFQTSWSILMADKKLLVFPFLSGIVSLIVLATFIVPLVIGQLFGSLISYAVLFAFYLVSEGGGFLGQLAAAIAGGAWGLVTFFVVPVLVLEDKGVFDSIKESATLIRSTWGESIIGSGSILLVFVLLGVLGFLGMMATLLTGSLAVFGIAVVLFIGLVIVLAVVGAA